MAVLDWLQQLLGGGPQPQGDLGRIVDRPYSADQPYQQPEQLLPKQDQPHTLDEAVDAWYGLTGIPDMQKGYQTYQQGGDPLAALGQAGTGAVNAASLAIPAAKLFPAFARTVGPLLGDEIGAVGDLRGIRAFHGSPHSFDRFDLGKIGTGEGAQAYGHGLYFAESEPVARGYKEKLSGLADTGYARQPTALEQQGLDLVNSAGVSQRWAASPAELRQRLIDNYSNTLATAPEDAIYGGRVAGERRLAALQSLDPALFKPPGHMYEVDINAKPEDFLDWDKPLREQPNPAARDFLTGQGIDDRRLGGDAHQDLVDFLWRNSPEYSQPGGAMRSTDQAAAQASEQLREAGIPGTRYLDQGSRAAGEGSSNYAIWTPEIVTIMRRFGLLPPLAAGGLLAAPGPGEAAPQ